jgi:hypothetical protein
VFQPNCNCVAELSFMPEARTSGSSLHRNGAVGFIDWLGLSRPKDR